MAVIDDDAGKVLGGISTLEPEFRSLKKQNTINATSLGEQFGYRLRDKKIKTVVFDRNGYLYHGVVKALADGARKAGVEF
jgi:large subunit ribosomal protein L18